MDAVTDRAMDNRAMDNRVMGRGRRRHMGPGLLLPRLLTVMAWAPTPDTTRPMLTAIRIRTMEASDCTSGRVLDFTGEVFMEEASAGASGVSLILLVTR